VSWFNPVFHNREEPVMAATKTRRKTPKLPITRENFGITLRMLRGPRSLEQIEEASGIPKSALSRWERGLVWPEVDRLARVCEVLGVRVDQVLGYAPLPDDWASRAWSYGQPQTLSA
jgi:transcriptional regulator with XRE-family HTH domain